MQNNTVAKEHYMLVQSGEEEVQKQLVEPETPHGIRKKSIE